MFRLIVRLLFGKPQPRPRLTMAQALDISLRRGYYAVDWGAVQ